MLPRLRFALGVCAAVLSSSPARASTPEPVRFSYAAFAGCPSEQELLDAIAGDGGALGRAAGEEPARRFAVTLEPGTRVVGRLVVTGIDGRDAVRTIEGERCDEVARSLAVLVALSLEDRPTDPPLRLARAPRVESTEPAERPTIDVQPPVERWRLGLSVEGTLSSGISPDAVLGIAIYAEVAHDSPNLFAPAFRLGFETTNGGSASALPSPSAQATFSRNVGRADACPFRLSARQPWAKDAISADACARLDAGMLSVGAAQTPSLASSRYPWVALGALLRIRWVIPPVFFDAEGGAMFPLVRERFHFEGQPDLFEVPAVAGVGGFGVGVYFL